MKLRSWIAAPLIVLMIALTGCQAIGGFDATKGLVSTLDVKSQEASQKLSLNVVAKPGISQGDKETIDLINSISVSLDHVKVQSQNAFSAEGTLHIEKLSLPFEVSMDHQALIFTLEGAKKPVYISLDSYSNMEGLPAGFNADQYTDQVNALVKEVYGLVMKHAPNPNTISVTPVTEDVYGEKVKLTQLHAEIRGDELVGLVKPLLTNLAQDEEGLKHVIGQVYEVATSLATAVDAEDAGSFVKKYQDNKEQAVNEAYTELKKYLDMAVAQYDTGVTMLYAEAPEIKTVLSSKSVFKTDLYFDSSANIRKQAADLTVALPDLPEIPVQSFTLHSESQSWNVNGQVTADKVDTSQGVIDLKNQSDLTPGATLRNFDSNSEVYSILKNDLKITQIDTTIDPDDSYYELLSRNNTTMIPLRNLANELDAELKWDAAAKQITVTDDITGATIKLKNGSKQAVLEGSTQTLPQAAFTDKYGTMYVPFKAVAQALGASVTFDKGVYVLHRD